MTNPPSHSGVVTFPEYREGRRAPIMVDTPAQRPKRPIWPWALAAVVIAAGIIAAVLFVGGEDEAPPAEPTRASNELAVTACRDAVKERLKSPGTAQFGDEFVRETGTTEAEVGGWVDSQNGFGALIRQRFVCVAHPGQTGWRISDVTFSEW